MKKKNIIIVTVLALILFIGGGIGLYFLNRHVEEDNKKTDAILFKEEYEALNGEKNKSGKEYPKVEIDEENPIKIKTAKEAASLMEGSGVFYFGFASCPWCRNAVPMLLKAAESNGLKDLYYVDTKTIRDTKIVKDGKVVTSKEAGEGYNELLEKLDSVLDEYVIKDDKGKEYKTGEKRLYAPTVVFVKDGSIVGIHVDTVKSHADAGDGYIPLTEKQNEELFRIYADGIAKALGNSCGEAC